MADNSESKHIMISYQWDSQKTMLKLRDKLRRKGYNVWMDVDKMGGDILSCMAKAVQNAEVVLMSVSQKYEESDNCKAEAQYAFQLKRLIIPLKFEDGFEPSDWLGPLMGLKLYYSVHSDEAFDKAIPDLIRELGDKCRKIEEEKWTPIKRQVSRALQCSICLERFKQPKSLPCLHSFCKECLVRVAPKGTQTISCPLCRESFPVPDGDVTLFRTNYHLKELIAEDAASQQQLSGGVAEFSCTCCDVGKQSKVVAKCQDCKLYICNTGLTAHERFPGLKEHDILVFEVPTEESTEETNGVEAPAEIIEEQKPELELKADWWEIFNALYDEEHSTNLFKYWMQQHGKDSAWQEIMAKHYLAGLTILEESGLLSEDLLARRQKQVAIVFKQVGQYDKAVELIEKTLDIEKKELGSRPEHMADLYYLAGDIYRDIINGITVIKDRDPTLIQKQMKYARLSLKLRKTMKGDDNKFELGRVLRVLCSALQKWMQYGGDSMLSAADARAEATKYIDESIQIFTQLNAKGSAAKSIMNKANLEEEGSEERERLLREAFAMCEEAYGECSVLSASLHRSLCLVYEARNDLHEAYKWLVKSQEIREKVYGRDHPRTKKVYDELEKEQYAEIRKEDLKNKKKKVCPRRIWKKP